MSIHIAGLNRISPERLDAFERRLITLCAGLGFDMIAMNVTEQRKSDEPPTIEIVIEQTQMLRSVSAPHANVPGLLAQVQRNERNPFWTLEALSDHLGGLWHTLGLLNREVGIAGNRPVFAHGTPEFHVAECEQIVSDLHGMLAVVLPELHAIANPSEQTAQPPRETGKRDGRKQPVNGHE